MKFSNLTVQNEDVPTLLRHISKWHHDRNLIDGATDMSQFAKLIQEAGELSDNLCKKKDIRDDIGDMIVVLVNIAERNGLSIEECLEQSWNDIKDRKGEMCNGVFLKSTDPDWIEDSSGRSQEELRKEKAYLLAPENQARTK